MKRLYNRHKSNELYPQSYGSWAGNKSGVAPDYKRCCAEVMDGFRSKQCGNSRGFGPKRSYCHHHDPSRAMEKAAARERKFNEQQRKIALGYVGPAVRALQQIEAGHNDPKALASEILNKLRVRHWWKEDFE